MHYGTIYDSIASAAQHYSHAGYAFIADAPWVVGKEAYYATKPEGAPDVVVERQGLQEFFVASGEQSFLQMMLDGDRFKRAYCITPCFRVEAPTKKRSPRYNQWKRDSFMKLELINADAPTRANLIQMIHDAAAFFEEFIAIRIIETGEDTYDIVEKSTRVELGSYGIRTHRSLGKSERTFTWIYGTGVAEPRLTQARAAAAVE